MNEKEQEMINQWLKKNKPTKCPDCYWAAEEKSEYEKARIHKDKKAKATKQWSKSQINSGQKIIGSIQ